MRLWGSIASSASGSDALDHATWAARLDLMGIRQAADLTSPKTYEGLITSKTRGEVYGSLGICRSNPPEKDAPDGRSGRPSQALPDRCRLGLRVGLTLRFPVLARPRGAYTTNFSRTETPIPRQGSGSTGWLVD